MSGDPHRRRPDPREAEIDIQKIERAAIGFVLGGLMGAGFSFLFTWIGNLLMGWLGGQPFEVTLGSILPVALVMGLAMAINMANPPFGD